MHNKNILIVDDSATDRQLLQTYLAPLGANLTFADNGESGVQKANTEKPDLIIMDIIMPGMNGFEATRKISKDSSTKNIPILICTSKDKETDKIWGMRQGAKDYIAKPIEPRELVRKIEELLVA